MNSRQYQSSHIWLQLLS